MLWIQGHQPEGANMINLKSIVHFNALPGATYLNKTLAFIKKGMRVLTVKAGDFK